MKFTESHKMIIVWGKQRCGISEYVWYKDKHIMQIVWFSSFKDFYKIGIVYDSYIIDESMKHIYWINIVK